MAQRLPDFLIAGAPRSGTTWLYHLLDRHPRVYLAKPVRPEPKFFLDDERYAQGLDYYLSTWFAEVPAGAIAGEKSTNYLESAAAAERIHRQLPGVKLVFILREPAERAYSNYLWSRMNGLEHEDFATALALETQREGGGEGRFRYSRPHAYFTRGLYAQQLRSFCQLFDRSQMLILRYEEVIESPRDLAARLHKFLGIELRPEDADGLGVINPSVKSGEVLDPAVGRRLRESYMEPNRQLAELCGFDVRSWGGAQ